MAGTTTCDATDCEKTTDAVLRLTRPDWMVEQVPSVTDKTSDVSLCSKHAENYGEHVSVDVEVLSGRI